MHTIHLPAVSPEINEGLRALHQQQHPLTLVTVSDSCAHSYADYTPFDYVIYNGLDLDAIPFATQLLTMRLCSSLDGSLQKKVLPKQLR